MVNPEKTRYRGDNHRYPPHFWVDNGGYPPQFQCDNWVIHPDLLIPICGKEDGNNITEVVGKEELYNYNSPEPITSMA